MKITRSVGEKRRLDYQGNCEQARINYVVSDVGMTETDQALTEVYALAPDTWQGIPKDSVEILHAPGGGMLEIGVTYRSEGANRYSFNSRIKKNGDREWFVDVSGTKVKRRKALDCIFSRSLNPSVPVPSPGNRVDWNGKYGSASMLGDVEIYEPDATLYCIATMRKNRAYSTTYIRTVLSLVGKVNSESFHNWNAGELLFIGMKRSGSVRSASGEDLCDVNFSFRVRCSRTQTLGGVTAEVDGWDYFWAMTRDVPGKNDISSVHISRFYERGSFALLDI